MIAQRRTLSRLLIASAFFGGALLPSAPAARHEPSTSGRPDSCEYTATLLKSTGTADRVRAASPEKRVGEYYGGDIGERPAPAGWPYPTSQEFPNLMGQRWAVTLVDLDNDCVDEVRFTAVAGSAYCETSYFFKRTDTGGYALFLKLIGEASICSGDAILTLRHEEQTLLLWYSAYASSLAEVGRDGKPHGLCRLTREPGPTRIAAACRGAICRAVAREAGRWPIKGESMVPIPSEPAAVRDVSVSSLQLDESVSSQQLDETPLGMLVDFDNDGKRELVVMSWQGPRWGDHTPDLPTGWGQIPARGPGTSLAGLATGGQRGPLLHAS